MDGFVSKYICGWVRFKWPQNQQIFPLRHSAQRTVFSLIKFSLYSFNEINISISESRARFGRLGAYTCGVYPSIGNGTKLNCSLVHSSVLYVCRLCLSVSRLNFNSNYFWLKINEFTGVLATATALALPFAHKSYRQTSLQSSGCVRAYLFTDCLRQARRGWRRERR